MVWHRQPGHAAAKALLTHYPTPRALRQALRAHGPAIIPTEVRELAWNQDCTIGGVLLSPSFGPREVATLHRILSTHAQDVEVWTAPDGTQTVRPV
jgi:hypothetical protein